VLRRLSGTCVIIGLMGALPEAVKASGPVKRWPSMTAKYAVLKAIFSTP